MKDMNNQADILLQSEQFDRAQIEEKRNGINDRYEK